MAGQGQELDCAGTVTTLRELRDSSVGRGVRKPGTSSPCAVPLLSLLHSKAARFFPIFNIFFWFKVQLIAQTPHWGITNILNNHNFNAMSM